MLLAMCCAVLCCGAVLGNKEWMKTRDAHLCLMACRNRSAAGDAFRCESCDVCEAMLDLQLRDSGGLVGLFGDEAAVACSVEIVGIALEDLVEMCPGRGGRLGRC